MMLEATEPTFAHTLQQTRKSLGWSQTKMAEHLGVSYVTLNRWENAKAEPTPLAQQKVLELSRSLNAPDAHDPEPEPTPPDFGGRAEAVRALAEGERLRWGFLYNAKFATETSLIDPLPHQILAVYRHMLPRSPLRFLLADDAGAGKTIMTGLDLKERLTRGIIRRVLVVAPAGLLGNWEREMRLLFGLPFRVVRGSDARDANPFQGPDSNLLIVSLDTLRQTVMFGRLQEDGVAPYDYVVFDEAHKLAADQTADGERKTDRYKLAEALCGAADDDSRWRLAWSCPNVLLLSATPHMGKTYPYYCLWRLLLPQVLTTDEAFQHFPAEQRANHFLRRMKEEMVDFVGKALYPTRISKTFSFTLQRREQQLYDEMTDYIQTLYNKAARLNQSAARLAMSVFQRRLASSSYAVLRSLERRSQRLDALIQDVEKGAALQERQKTAADEFAQDALDFDAKTADEETSSNGHEERERVEDDAVTLMAATDLPDLKAEAERVRALLTLAREVHASGEESKFETLRAHLEAPEYKSEKILIFTEHRDTLTHLVQRLEGIGYAGRVAQIHGGMDYEERQEQIERFRAPDTDGGATYLVATDAAGEGINLQFAWLLINFDLPWNPARLEQRMGRLHRYGQKHDPVVICNMIAGATREGRVMQTLLDKLEQIREDTGSDRVYDVVGELLDGVSLTSYLSGNAQDLLHRIEAQATTGAVQAITTRGQEGFGSGSVIDALPSLCRDLERETLRALLPGYIRSDLESLLPLLNIGIDGDLGDAARGFGLRALRPGALDFLGAALDFYPPADRSRFTVVKTPGMTGRIFLHPGEPVFDALQARAHETLAGDAARGAVFVDAQAAKPRLFYLARVGVAREPDAAFSSLTSRAAVTGTLVGLCLEPNGTVTRCPAETLLPLSAPPDAATRLRGLARSLKDYAPSAEQQALVYAREQIAQPLAATTRAALEQTLPLREGYVRRGFGYLEAELAERRSEWRRKMGDPRAAVQMMQIRDRQRALGRQRDDALAALAREIELTVPDDVEILARALIVPSASPDDGLAQDKRVEAEALRVVFAYEQARGATVQDVSTEALARAADLDPWPGFDLLSTDPSAPPGLRERAIEVKGRVGTGSVELTENEWSRACNLGAQYWLYVVYDCGSLHPRLLRVQDPFRRLTARARLRWVIEPWDVAALAEE